ncbi:MAG: primosomal protein N' [Solirubrobacteraceae bacterium]|nr:primosomal protein N' [Solirubrobacteraceae bacterium]
MPSSSAPVPSPSGPSVIQVEPLVTARAVRGPFDYARPDGVDVGSVVEVPFGRQRLRAVVTGLTDASEHRLKAPIRVLDVRIAPELVRLALWMADDVVSTRARCLELLLPPEGGERRRLWAERVGEPADRIARTTGVRLTANQRALLDRLPDWTGPDTAALRRLEARGLVRIEERTRPRRPDPPAVGPTADGPLPLNPDQAAAVDRLAAAPDGSRILLHGVTGSGKTEVYLQAARRVLDAGHAVLVLVPEIALTPQTVARFRRRLGETVAVLHSGLSRGERRDEWWRLHRGDARVCVGPMSAVFAPVRDLGLVIVDEEHDPAFKHDGDPRYDARRVAAWRATADGATLLVGSATPRPESWAALERVSLPRRADGRDLPPVELVDMRRTRTVLHPDVHRALVDARKAIVLLNRRGWATSLECADCGHAWECPNCDVSLVLHGGRRDPATADGDVPSGFTPLAPGGTLRCHHCGHRERPPTTCPECRSVSIGHHGLGTAQLAEQLPGHVFRLDADVTDRAGVLDRFGRAEEGILVGTQMIAKGHDFPDVGVGVVVDADATLRFPDFRGQERTFQLVAQLAGRAGRGGDRRAVGRVLVQTRAPSERALRHAAEHDAEGFLAGELERRAALGYPPYSTLVRVTCEHEDERRVDRTAMDLRLQLPRDALGPAAIFRRQGRYRRTLELRGPQRRATVDAVRRAVDAIVGRPEHRGVVLAIEVDPR